MTRPQALLFDADDTLWHNENIFTRTHDLFREMLLAYHPAEWIDTKLYETEIRNLHLFGYGVKGFTLSMIETAIELTEGRVSGSEIQSLIEIGKDMLRAPVEPLPGVVETLDALARCYPLYVVTKGDLFDQESKVARSGLGDFFHRVEVVSEKDVATYRAIFKRHQLTPERLVMVGNSLKSDILPVLELGVCGIHIPYHTTWAHENVGAEQLEGKTYHRLNSMADLLDFLPTLHFPEDVSE